MRQEEVHPACAESHVNDRASFVDPQACDCGEPVGFVGICPLPFRDTDTLSFRAAGFGPWLTARSAVLHSYTLMLNSLSNRPIRFCASAARSLAFTVGS